MSISRASIFRFKMKNNPKRYTVIPLSNYVAGRYDDIMRQMNNLESDPDVQEIIK